MLEMLSCSEMWIFNACDTTFMHFFLPIRTYRFVFKQDACLRKVVSVWCQLQSLIMMLLPPELHEIFSWLCHLSPLHAFQMPIRGEWATSVATTSFANVQKVAAQLPKSVSGGHTIGNFQLHAETLHASLSICNTTYTYRDLFKCLKRWT